LSHRCYAITLRTIITREDIVSGQPIALVAAPGAIARGHADGLPYANIPGIPQLRAFASVAQSRSISRGAADLARSQPAVTQSIANLEASYGMPLFLRKRTGLILTDAGLILHSRVCRYFAEVRGAVQECGAERGWSGAQVDVIVNRLTRPLTTALLLIDEHGSVPRAAQALGQREATLRKAVISLEAELEVRLFNRDFHGMTTNHQGQKLAARLRLAMRELEAAREEVNARLGVEDGRILAGAMMLAGNQMLTSVLERFTRLHPQACVSVMNAGYDVLLDRLKRGGIDFVVGLQNNPSPDENVVEQVIASDPFVLAVRKGHPLTRRGAVRKADLVQYDWVLSAPGAVRRDAFERLFANMTKPIGRVETHSIVTILSLLANSDAIAILTRSELLLDQQFGGHLAPLDFGPIEPESNIALTMRRGWLPTHLQTAFARCLVDATGA
jgi:LysR family transcriptional regulator of gallate degradation